MELALETIELTKVFRDFWHREKVRAVDKLNLSIYGGEVFGLLGPNGSGKTTTIKLILGLLFPTSGLVRVFGLPPRNISLKSRIGFLPEESYFYRHLNADETMDFYGKLFGLPGPERRKRTERLLGITGLTGARNRPVGEYSKGMARRIGIAQALINDPELVILDEPTSGLDPIGRREVKDLILDLKKLGKTIFLSSHLLADVEDVCDRIAILYSGRLIAEGKVKELLTNRNITQISLSGISAEELESVLESLRRKTEVIAVSSPTESLESFFLNAIRQLESAEKEKKKAEKPRAEEAEKAETIIEKLSRPDTK